MNIVETNINDILIALDWIEKELSMANHSWLLSRNMGYIFTSQQNQYVINKLNSIGIDIAPSEIIHGDKDRYIYVKIIDVINHIKSTEREDKLNKLLN
jgi:hypothetical protein